MSEAAPEFDAVHPSGHVLFRSSRGGYLHSTALSEGTRGADAGELAAAVLLAAEVSHLRAVMQIRREIIDAGFSPSAGLATPAELHRAEAELSRHRLTGDDA